MDQYGYFCRRWRGLSGGRGRGWALSWIIREVVTLEDWGRVEVVGLDVAQREIWARGGAYGGCSGVVKMK